jgi:hypothetical protein
LALGSLDAALHRRLELRLLVAIGPAEDDAALLPDRHLAERVRLQLGARLGGGVGALEEDQVERRRELLPARGDVDRLVVEPARAREGGERGLLSLRRLRGGVAVLLEAGEERVGGGRARLRHSGLRGIGNTAAPPGGDDGK